MKSVQVSSLATKCFFSQEARQIRTLELELCGTQGLSQPYTSCLLKFLIRSLLNTNDNNYPRASE